MGEDGNVTVLMSDDNLETLTYFTTAPADGTAYYDASAFYDGFDSWFYTVRRDQYLKYNYLGDNALYTDYTGPAADDYEGMFGGYDGTITRWGVEYLRLISGWTSSGSVAGITRVVADTPTLVKDTGGSVVRRIRDNGSILVALKDGTTYYTSTNSTTWTDRTLPASVDASGDFFDVLEGGMFCWHRYGTVNFYTSTDGINWTARTLPLALNRATFAHDGAGGLVAMGLSSGPTTQRTYRSSDTGGSWTEVTSPALGYSSVFPVFFDGADFKCLHGSTSTNVQIYKLIDATPPETVWSNVIGCQIS
jgi:hypothetical protein